MADSHAPPVSPVVPPEAARHPQSVTHHGVALTDDYGWLRDAHWQDVMRDPARLDPAIRDHLDAENRYAEAMLADTQALQETLFAEMKGRLKEDDSTVPSPDGPFDYYSSYTPGGQYPRLCRRSRDGADETIVLDGNAEAAHSKYWSLGGYSHSPDHSLLAYSVDDRGSEQCTLLIRDLATGQNLADRIPNTRYGTVWTADSRHLYYVRLDERDRPRYIYRHTLGQPVASDVLVYEEHDPGFFVGVTQTQSRAYIVIMAHDHETSEAYLVDAENPDVPLRCVAPRESGIEYNIEHHGDRLILMTNTDGAEDFSICDAPVAAPGRENWRVVVPHEAGRLIVETLVFKRHMVWLERRNALPQIVIRRLSDGAEHPIAFSEDAYSLGLAGGYEFDTDTVRFHYSSMTTPTQVYDYDMETRARVLRKTQEVPSGHDPAHYVTRRVLAPAPDGETVPISLLYRRDTPLDGSAPLLLYGYGSYGITIPASFATARLSLVDRGFVYAIVHIRGGKDKGYRWYRDGKREKKTNTFTDFIAAGEYLAAQGVTARGRIVAHGGSAGGLLMGAVANMRPDLFLGIIASVPFVDVLNTILDSSLPLTPPEWPEWGNPIESAEDFAVIQSYSPYDNVIAQAYPHIYAFAGLTDPRVTYWEPAKWIAKLRRFNTSANLVLLKTNMGAGHGGASGRYERLKETAVDYAFALKIAGRTGSK